MATQRRSLPALEKLKSQHQQLLKNYHNPRIMAVLDEIAAEKAEQSNVVMKAIEEYVLKNYPQCKRFLKCESGHSTSDGTSIKLGFKFEATVNPKQVAKLNELKKKADADKMALEQWYTRFLSNCASGDSVPDFRLAHLEGTSSERKHYYGGYV